ncbi:MAG: hypothetical protein KGJ24_08975 [Burkholderiales bacterium]|nr:hypothetical protein [Burkholderiales bacterium]
MADAPNPPAALAGSTGENTAATGAAGSSGSKTVDMLIELQARAQADGASGAKAERTASAPRRDRLADIAEKAARAAPLAQAPHFGGLFSTTASSPQGDPISGMEGDGGRAMALARGGTDPVSAPWLLRWLAWPRDAVGFIREHRHWVLAGVVLALALMWLRMPRAGTRRR